MDRLEEQLREVMARSALEADQFRPLSKRRLRRIRLLQSLFVFGSVSVIVAAILGVAWGVRIVSGPAPAVPVQQAAGPETLYVLDFAPGGDALHSALLALEVSDASVRTVRSYPLGNDPDVALSPDGSRLYAVSRVPVSDTNTRDTLSVIDSATGSVVQEVPVPFWQGTTGRHITQKIAASPDGAYVYVLVGFVDDPIAPPQSLATFDVAQGAILSDLAPLDGCGGSPTILPRSGASVIVVCRQFNQVRFIQLAKSGGIESEQRLSLPGTGATVEDEFGNKRDVSFISGAVLSPSSEELYAVARDGRVFVVDVTAQALTGTIDLQLPADMLVGVPQVAISPDGEQIILGLGPARSWDAVRADTVFAVDIATWSKSSETPTAPFWAFAVAGTTQVFTIEPETGALASVDINEGVDAVSLGQFGDLPVAIYSGPDGGE